MKYATYVCFGYEPGVTPLRAEPATTPECEPHEPQPDGYVARSDWAAAMLRTHVQRTCKGCGRWLVWVPRFGEEAAGG